MSERPQFDNQPTIFPMTHLTQQPISPQANLLPPDFSLGRWIDQHIDAKANLKFEALLAQQSRDFDRAKRRNSSEMAERYGVSLKRIQDWTRNGTLPADRAPDGFGHWSYLTGACDDAIAKLRRPDGTIKGTWRPKGCTNKKGA